MSAIGDALHARGGLQHALVAMDRARLPETPDFLRVAELWQGMSDGRWSVVEHFDWDGHRYLLLCSAATGSRAATRLSRREQQVLDLANRGFSNKLIGYSLELSISTVSTHLTRARKKLSAREKVSARTIVEVLGLETIPP